ncbi:2'-5' RNA ligase superfamily protein [Pontibacter ummariensis]|uniref:2'-5' RNA ligase superfamily protein n=1 Tax=Pontibacter ummariensis TaxID=1610492 RepID=A0A239BZF3_9BACT|nr:2'-5' RNA ligase family protein [Pontibacter ummariensis]PRY15524.1 2'-5' RNA ligase superfamily protein [Pontibacter ummariensis]SNS13445.1 2'-5' RNA ligase superfamily protein [Pontibacter ummariensis]
MIAITSLLDKKTSARVTELTEHLEEKFGLAGVKVTPYPHLTLLTAEIPDMEELKQYLESVTFETENFTIRTTGLGVFPGPNPVVYIPVLRTAPLNNLHGTLHRDIAEMSTEMGVYYNPNLWLPHISLALGDTSPEILGPMFTFLCQYNFNWEITLDNLTILQKCGDYFLKDEEFHFGRPELKTNRKQSLKGDTI